MENNAVGPGLTVRVALTPVVTPLMFSGAAANVYVPIVSTTRLENVATPLLRATVVVPELKVVWGLPSPVGMDMETEPVAVVTTLP
jgi:hypothetical protein